MKKTILTVGIAMLFVVGSATFIGCGNSENHEESESHEHAEGEEHHEEMEMNDDHMDEEAEHAKYQCPMKCEEDKMYDEAGSCPVCGMDLKEVE